MKSYEVPRMLFDRYAKMRKTTDPPNTFIRYQHGILTDQDGNPASLTLTPQDEWEVITNGYWPKVGDVLRYEGETETSTVVWVDDTTMVIKEENGTVLPWDRDTFNPDDWEVVSTSPTK